MQGARLFLRFARFDHGRMKKRRPGMQAPLPRIRSTVSTIPHTHRRRKNWTRQVSRSPEDRPGRGAPMSPPKTNLPAARRQATIISPCRPRRQCRWAREEDGTRTKKTRKTNNAAAIAMLNVRLASRRRHRVSGQARPKKWQPATTSPAVP